MFLGRAVRPGDPQWLPTDSGLALAWAQHRAEVCPGCGTRKDEWDADRDTAYIPDVHYCRGCELLAEARADMPKDEQGKPKPGFHPYLLSRRAYEQLHPDDDG